MKNEFSFFSDPDIGTHSEISCNPNKGWYGIDDYYDNSFRTRTKFSCIDELKNKRIILVAGDSFTFGDGVYYQDTFSSYLKEHFFKDDEFIVINVAQPGSSNDYIIQQVQNWLNILSDQIETIILGLSFISRRCYFFDNEYTINFENSLYDRDSSTLTIEQEIYKYNFNINNSYPKQNRGYNVKKVYNNLLETSTRVNDYREFEKSLLLMKYISHFYNIKTYWWGWLAQSFGTGKNKDRNRIIQMFNGDNLTFMDIDSIANTLECLSEDDGHWSKNGHRDVANIIIGHLEKDERYNSK